MTRRKFLLAAAAASGAGVVRAGGQGRSNGSVSFCAFADIHYFPRIWPNDKIENLERILRRAEAAKTDFTIHLGDFCHDVIKDRNYVDLYNNFSQPTYHVIGNHDGERNGLGPMFEAYRLKNNYYSFDRCGFRFIVGDPNYMYTPDGKDVHYERYNVVDTKRTKSCYFPPEQTDWIREQVNSSPYPCVFFSHESLEREYTSVTNWEEIRGIFDEANKAHPGRVRLVINGHFHIDNFRLINNIGYLDLNSANFQYYVKPHDKFPADFVKAHQNAPHALAWEDPLSAIITLTQDGGIRIEGSESKFIFGLTPQKAGLPLTDAVGRITLPRIRSVDLKINWAKS